MAYSWEEHLYPAGTTSISVNIQYLDRSYIYLYVDNEEVLDYTWESDVRIRLDAALTKESKVLIVRRTAAHYLYINFKSGAPFISENLDTQNTQFLHLAQEMTEGRSIEGFYGAINMNGFRIINLAAGEEATDAINKAQLDEVDSKVKALEGTFIGHTNSYPWYTVIVSPTKIIAPPYSFTKAAVYLNGVCQTPGYSYSVDNNTITLAEEVPAGTHVFVRLGEDILDATYVTVVTYADLIQRLTDPDGAVNSPELQVARWRDNGDVRGWGAKVDGGANDSGAFNAVAGAPAHVPNGTSRCSPGVFSIAGLTGEVNSKLKQVAPAGNFLSFRQPDGGRIANLDIESNKGGVVSAQGHQIDVQDGRNVTLENLNFKEAEGTGFSIITYSNTLPYQEGFIVKGIRGKYNTSVANADAGCVLLDRNRKSLVDGVIATGYPQFGAVELKNDAKYNITSNIIGDNCESTVYLGTETEATPNANIISNIISSKPGFSAVEVGGGRHNLMSNVLADYTESTATSAHGVTMTGESNVADNILMMGSTGVNSIGGAQSAYNARFRGTARNNYASIFPHYTATGVVTFEGGTARNFVEIKHPGSRSSIFAQASTITDKATITGDVNSNVVHAPALGQYFGTMSGTFDWRIKDVTIPSRVFVTADRFRFICDGAVSMAVGGGTTSQLKLFNSDGTARTLSLNQNQSIRLDIGSRNYLQFSSNVLTPSQTNAYSLGNASNAWAGGTTQTAFTVLSDERAKSKPLTLARGSLADIITSDGEQVYSSDAVLDAWAEVDLVQYQLLDRIEEKGEEGARWHFGVLAQRAVEAFSRHGLDAHRFAFLCYDEWDDQYGKVQVGDGEYIEVLETPAGNRYGIRYEEALILEAALQRRNYSRLVDSFNKLSSRIDAIEAVCAP